MVRGNHDSSDAIFETGLVYEGSDYAVYVMDSGSQSFSTNEIADLSNKLNAIPTSKPVFVASHCPIHAYSIRATVNADSLLTRLNKHENVIFLWGHNHTAGDPYYGNVMKKGFNIKTTSTGQNQTINFTYLSYGAMNQGNNSAYGLLATLTKNGNDTQIDFSYRKLDGTQSSATSSGTVVIKGEESKVGAVYELVEAPASGETYVVVGKSGSDYYALTNEEFSSGSTKYLKGEKVGVSEGIMTSDVNEKVLWKFTTEKDGFNVMNGTNYLNRLSGGSAGFELDTTKAKVDYSDWIYVDKDFYTYSALVKKNFYMYIAESGSTYYFGNTNEESGKPKRCEIYLYKLAQGTPVEKYTVTFDSNGGSAVVPITGVAKNETVTLPAPPTKPGHIFKGWYTENHTFNNPFTESTPVIANITVYAKWATQQIDPTGTIYIGLTSDVHGNLGNLTTWISNLKNSTPTINSFVFGGDYPVDRYQTGENSSVSMANKCSNIVKTEYGNNIPVILVRGNHDPKGNEIFPHGLQYNSDDYAIFVMDSPGTSSSTATFLDEDINDLNNKLNIISPSKPVFVVSHCPLHYYNSGGFSRSTAKADELLQVLNKHENVIFVWGHYHTLNDPSYGKVYTKEDKYKIRTTASGQEQELKFTYVNFGAMNQGNNGANGLLVTLTKESDNTHIKFDYKNLKGERVSGGEVTIESIPSIQYTLTLTGEGITSVPAAGLINENTLVTVTVAPPSGKQVATFTVGGADKKTEIVNNQYTFNITTNTTIAVTYENIPPEDPPTDRVYELTNILEAGETYVIVVMSDAQYYILANAKPTNFDNFLSGIPITLVDDNISNYDIMPNMLWLAENNSSFGHMYLKNSGGYLQRQTGTDGKLSVSTPREDKGGYDNWQYNGNSLYTISTQISGTNTKFALFYDSKGYLRANNTEGSVVYLYKLTEEVLEDKEIIGNIILTDITVEFGTQLSEIGLPDTVLAELDDESNIVLSVSWDDGTPKYNGNIPGTYRFEGELEEKEGILNTDQFVAVINVIVKEETIIKKEITGVNILEDISVELGTLVKDIDFPDKVSVNLSDGTGVDLSVSWDDGTPEYDGDVAGQYEFTGEITLTADITNPDNHVAKITVIVLEETVEDKNIVSVEDIDSIEVPYDTEKIDVGLPTAVAVTLEDDTVRTLGVIWDNGTPSYNPKKAGEYEFEGTINLMPGVINNENLKAKVTVIVKEEEEPPVRQYTITFDSDGGSPVSPIIAPAGTAISKPANPTRSGYKFLGWKPEVPDTMPEKNLTVVAQWEKSEPENKSTGGSGGGTVIRVVELTISKQPTKTEYIEGEVFDPSGMEVTVKYSDKTTKKVKGFKYTPVDELKTSDNKITVTYGGKSANVNIIVKASKIIEVPIEEMPVGIPYPDFKDVPHDSPYYEAIKFVTTRGLYQGINNAEFGPDIFITRSMFVTILSRFEFGNDDNVPKGSVQFIDLPQEWYKNAISWAYRNKITLGISDTMFNPEGILNREQMVVFLYRYAKFKGFDTSTDINVLTSIIDGEKVSDFAKEAMAWALKNGFVNAVDNVIAPQQQATRAESAEMFMRFTIFQNK